MLIATALTLALIGFVASMLAKLVRQDGFKIIAALHGQSWAAGSLPSARPVTVRFNPRYKAARADQGSIELRAAA